MAEIPSSAMERPSERDGYYVLAEGGEFIAFEQERACRFHEARFASRSEAQNYVAALHSVSGVQRCGNV